MNCVKLLSCLFVFIISFSVNAQTVPDDIPLSFPFFQSTQSTGIPDELMVGYGDWCAAEEGLHMGIDFFAGLVDDQVLNPFNTTMYSIGADYKEGDYTGCIIGISFEDSDFGWALEHLEPEHDGLDPDTSAWDWCGFFHRGITLELRTPISHCLDYSSGSVPLHTHVQWSHWFNPSGYWPGIYRMSSPWECLVNPMDSGHFIAGELDDYDQTWFKAVWPEQLWPIENTNTGVFFLPEGIEWWADYESALGSAQVNLFQDIIHGAVDIAVSPYSMLNDYQENNGCGVYSVGYEIYHQNPVTMGWSSTKSVEGNWGYRDLFMADGQIEEPSLWVDIYEALFHDKSLFENALIITNSGALDTASWTTGWDNVWTDTGFVNDWTTGICQGAWDTFLEKQEISGDPTQNSEAFFPDGRYAVRVTAVSHG